MEIISTALRASTVVHINSPVTELKRLSNPDPSPSSLRSAFWAYFNISLMNRIAFHVTAACQEKSSLE
jgi:hypothetical protein